MIILGDNQYLGVNHASASTASAYKDLFTKDDEIIRHFEGCVQAGISGFSFTVTTRMLDIVNEFESRGLLDEIDIYPSVPFAREVAQKLTDEGLVEFSLKRALNVRFLPTALRAIWSDVKLCELLLSEYRDVLSLPRIKSIALLNTFVDFCIPMLGIRAPVEAVQNVFEKPVSIFTYNPHFLSDDLIADLHFLSYSYNFRAFRSCCPPEEHPAHPEKLGAKFIGMGVLASGLGDLSDLERFFTIYPHAGLLVGSSKCKNIAMITKLQRDVSGREGLH